MELRVESSQFAPNHGGGGGGFYQGRGQGDERGQQDERDGQQGRGRQPKGRGIGKDICVLPGGRKSDLGLASPLRYAQEPKEVVEEAPIDLGGLDDEIKRNLRMMTLMVVRLERDFERRLTCEVGDVVIGA